MDNHLHIICLNVPYPVDYGGVFDLYYKLPALSKLGIKIHLHCFDYGRGNQPILNQYCNEVQYYKRKIGWSGFSFQYPYIVSSRINDELIDRLAKDNYPILLEGVHCTWLLNDARFSTRKLFVRLHNVEHIYYHFLYKNTPNLYKKIYYLWESFLLKRYETRIAQKTAFLAVSKNDAEVYQSLGATDTQYLPLFLPEWEIKATEGKGSFCLYQGDLSVPENEIAAIWLLENVFVKNKIPFVAAGKNPSKKLTKLFHQQNTTCIIENPSEKEMQDLIRKAHINLIPSFNNTGIKLKLINALYNGRHCVVNPSTIIGTGLNECCAIGETAEEFSTIVNELYNKPFTNDQIEIRRKILNRTFNNIDNAIKLSGILNLEIATH